MRQVFVALLLMIPAIPLVAKDEPKTMAEAFARAAKLSQITLPGSPPFHPKATIAEIDSPDSDYKAEIEEDWVAPDKWRRTIKTPGFFQTMIVNGAQVLEQSTGDYYPFWLQDLVIALFDLAPGNLKELNAKYVSAAALREQLAQRAPECREESCQRIAPICGSLPEFLRCGTRSSRRFASRPSPCA